MACSPKMPDWGPLLIRVLQGLVILRLLDLFAHRPQCLLQELGGFLAVRSFETHGINLNLASGPDDDFDGSVHDAPISTSLMDPFG